MNPKVRGCFHRHKIDSASGASHAALKVRACVGAHTFDYSNSPSLLSCARLIAQSSRSSMVFAGSIDQLAAIKILLHAAKHPHLAVNGILLGSKKSITDVIPLFHNSLHLAAPTEIALTQIDAYVQQPGHPQVVGYYHAEARFQAADMTPLSRRLGDRIADKYPDSCVLLLDSKKLAAFLENEKEAAVAPPFELFSREGKGSSWKREQGQISVSPSSTAVREAFFPLFEQQAHRRLVDFDDHFDDLTKDYLNPGLATMGKVALPGQLR